MLLRATKDTHEREEDEAERLVRPAPKVKPPRKDRRREDIRPERDSDTAGDPDLKGDRDLSLNYKTIGGSASIVARYLSGKSNIKYVSVIDTQAKDPAKQVISIPEDTAKANPSRYKIQKGPESQTPADSAETPKPGAPAGSPPPFEGSAYHQDIRKQLQDLEKSDPKAKAFLDAAKKPGGQIYEIAKENPSLPLPSLSFKLPSQVRTFGDLVNYLKPGAKAPEAPAAKPPGAKKSPAETPAAKPNLPEAPRPDPERTQSLRFLSDAQKQDQEGFNKFLLDLPTIDRRQGDRALVIYDKKTKTRVPINQASAETLKEVASKYQAHKLETDFRSALAYHKDKPEVQAALKDLAFVGGKTKEQGEEEGELAKRLRDLQKQGYPLESLSISKHVPELDGINLPSNLQSVKDLADLASKVSAPSAKSEKKPEAAPGKKPADKPSSEKPAPEKKPAEKPLDQRVVERFKESLSNPDFKSYVEGLPTSDRDSEGNVLFLDKSVRPKKHVPFEKLPVQAQKDLLQTFDDAQKQKAQTKFVEDLAASDPKLRTLLSQLSSLSGRPKGEESASDEDSVVGRLQSLQAEGHALDDLPLKKHIPELAQVALPEGLTTVADLVKAAQTLVPPPVRKELPPQEAQDIAKKLRLGLGSERAAQLAGLHPADQKAVLTEWYRLSTSPLADDKQFLKDLETLKGADIANLTPPKKIPWKGKMVDYDRLKPQDKANALQEYKNRLTAVRLVAQDQYKGFLSERLPKPLVNRVVTETPEPFEKVFRETLTDGQAEKPLPSSKVKQVFRDLSPASWPTVTAYFQARDLQDVHDRYLRSNVINEQLPASEIIRQLRGAGEELRARDGLYPKEHVTNTAASFRNLVLKHMESLARQGIGQDKYRQVKEWAQKQDHDDYDRALKEWRVLAEKARKTGDYDTLPSQPKKPEGYEESSSGSTTRLWSKLKSVFSPKATKQASTLNPFPARYLSTCKGFRVMPSSSRTALYWGVAPYPKDHEGFAPYNEWEQLHARDWSEKDAKVLLDAAKEWLKSDMLTLAMEGSEPDTAYRAALDLALRVTDDGKYSVGVHPAIYNELLAKLAGEPVDETLLTIREASVSPYINGLENTMKPSTRLSRIASMLADSDPSLAFEIADLAVKVAQQEKPEEEPKPAEKSQEQESQGQKQAAYATLRSAIIRTAHENSQARQALLPVLKLIQQLG